MVNSKPKPRSRKRRLAKILLGFIAGVVILLILAIVVLRLLYPPDRIREMVVEYVRNEFQRDLSIGYVSINPFRGFVLHDIEISPLDEKSDSLTPFPVYYARISHAELHYSLQNIFDKQLLVNKFVIDTLDVSLKIPIYPKPLSSDSLHTVPKDTSSAQLPIGFDIKTIAIHRAHLRVRTVTDTLEQLVELTNLSLYLNDWILPKDELDPQGRLLLELNDGLFKYRTIPETVSLDALANAKIKGHVYSLDQIDLDFQFHCPQFLFKSPDLTYNLPLPITFASRANIKNRLQSVKIPSFSMTIGDQEWADIEIGLEQLQNLDVRVNKGQIPVQQLISLAEPVIPDSLLNQFVISTADPAFSIQGSTLMALLPSDSSGLKVDFKASVQLDPTSLKTNPGNPSVPNAAIENIAMEMQASGQLIDSVFTFFKVASSIYLDSAHVALSDTTNFTAGSLRFEAGSELDSAFLPSSLRVNGEWKNIKGALLSYQMNFQGQGVESLRGQGSIRLENFLPHRFYPTDAETKLNVDIHFDAETLEQIKSNWVVSMDTLWLNTFPPQNYPPLELRGQLLGRVNPERQQAWIDSLSIRLGNIFSADLDGRYDSKGTELNLRQVQLNHKNAFDYLPANILEKYYDLKISGQTYLSGKIGLDEKGIQSAQVLLNTQNTDFEYPGMGVIVRGIKLDAETNIDSILAISSSASLTIDSVITDQVKGFKLKNNRITLDLKLLNFDQVYIDSLSALIPDFGLFASMTGVIDSLAGHPHVSSTFRILQDSAKDTLFLLPDIGYSGKLALDGSLTSDTLLATADIHLQSERVSFILPQETTIENINGSIRGEQTLDLQQMVLIQKADAFLSTPSEGSVDYQIYGPYYNRMYPEINDLNISSIQAAGYRVDNINIKSLIKDGRIEIPSLTARMYDGDLIGRLYLDLARGDLERAKYHVSAHFSNINSELLWAEEQREGKKSILNGNVELDGQGIDPRSDMQLGGHFNITEIGSKVMLNLLRAADPEGKDSGVNITQRLVNWGFKPQLVTYNIRHGYFQTTVYLDPPWYFPVRLGGGKIEFTRKPLAFFLNQFRQTFTTQ